MDAFDNLQAWLPSEFINILSHDNIEMMRNQDQSELHIAARKGSVVVVEELLEEGFDINSINESGNTALHMSARQGHSNVVEVLLSRGIDINTKNVIDKTALYYAARYSQVNVTEILLAGGIDIDNNIDMYAPRDEDEDAVDCRHLIFAELESRRKKDILDSFISRHIEYLPYISSIYTQCYPLGSVQVATPSIGWIAAVAIRDRYYFDEMFFYLHMHVANVYKNVRPDTIITTSSVNSMDNSANNSDKTATLMYLLTGHLKMMLKPNQNLGIEDDYASDSIDDDDDGGDGEGDGNGDDNNDN